MSTRNIFWSPTDAALTVSLASWLNPDGFMLLEPDATLAYDDRSGFVLGQISPNEAIDFITINLTAGNNYTFFSIGESQTSISIYDEQVYLLNFFDGDDIGLFDEYPMDSIFQFIPAQTGTYYISISLEKLSPSESYIIFGAEDIFANERNDLADGGVMPPSMSVSVNGIAQFVPATVYVGPVVGLQWQFLASDASEAVAASDGADFVNLLGGDDAADGRGGNDVLDGGLGSNFLTGGSGRDVFFLDGRGGNVTWATITDWEADEQLSLWGFRPGVSRMTWVEREGAPGFQGITLHVDLDGNQTIDASVTWAGRSREQLPTALPFDGLLWFV